MKVWLSLIFVCCFLRNGFATTECGLDEFPCDDGSCIEKFKWCDSIEHCKDDSDEHYCYKRTENSANPNRCNANFFICSDGPCIPLVGRCDGYPSCHDLSDEADCGTTLHPTAASTTSKVAVLTSPRVESAVVTELPTSLAHSIEYAISSEASPENDTTESAMQQNSFYPTTNSTQLMTPQHDEPSVHNEIYDVAHADTGSKPPEQVLKDITKGFIKLDTRAFSQWKYLAQKWILSVRDENYGWGDETARAVTALHMSDDPLKKTEEKFLMLKELHLKISVALIRNQTEKMPLSELSLYINALLASCDNPRNFYGNDLVGILRHRTNSAQIKAEFVSPLVYLTLCFSKASTHTDVRKIQEIFSSGRPEVDKIGIQALATLAAICTSDIQEFKSYKLGLQLAKRLFEKVAVQGLPENIYELALTVQALNEAKINQDVWNRSDALNQIGKWQESDGSWGDILSTYYVLPILSGKSLISLSNHCFPQTQMDMTPLDVLMNSKDDKLPVTYSLYFGEPMTVSQSLRTRVSKSARLLDIMRIAERKNSIYRFKYDMARGRPSVYSIGGMANDAEQGLYWVLHLSRRNATGPSKENLAPFEEDIRTYVPIAADHIVFWLKKLH